MSEPWRQGPVIVTGGTGLLGRGIARAFLVAGARVAIVGSRPERSAAAIEALQAAGEVRAFNADLSDADALVACFAEIEAAMGRVGVLVNGAGMNANTRLDALDASAFDALMAINVRSAFLLSKLGCASMQAAGTGGRIVNITSGNYRYVRPGSALYSASKAALESLTRSFALEYGHAGITVNAVAPGLIMPESTVDTGFRRIADYYRANSSLGRVTTAADVADAALFLASAKAAAITGHSIVIDNGFSSGRLDFPTRA